MTRTGAVIRRADRVAARRRRGSVSCAPATSKARSIVPAGRRTRARVWSATVSADPRTSPRRDDRADARDRPPLPAARPAAPSDVRSATTGPGPACRSRDGDPALEAAVGNASPSESPRAQAVDDYMTRRRADEALDYCPAALLRLSAMPWENDGAARGSGGLAAPPFQRDAGPGEVGGDTVLRGRQRRGVAGRVRGLPARQRRKLPPEQHQPASISPTRPIAPSAATMRRVVRFMAGSCLWIRVRATRSGASRFRLKAEAHKICKRTAPATRSVHDPDPRSPT